MVCVMHKQKQYIFNSINTFRYFIFSTSSMINSNSFKYSTRRCRKQNSLPENLLPVAGHPIFPDHNYQLLMHRYVFPCWYFTLMYDSHVNPISLGEKLV